MDCALRRGRAALDDGSRWGMKPMFFMVKSRGFEPEGPQPGPADRRERLVLIMSTCIDASASDALMRRIVPYPLKKIRVQTTPEHWSFKKLCHSLVSWFKRGLRRLMRCLQNDLSLS